MRVVMDETLDQREEKREVRNGLGRFVMGVGVALAAAGGLTAFDGHAVVGAWMAGIGAPVGLIGAVWAWRNRPGDDALELGASASVIERAHRNRSIMLVLSPVFMLIFGAISLEKTGKLLAGEGDAMDWLMIGAVIVYAWLGPLIVLGRGGLTASQRRLLEDELTRHHRSVAAGLGLTVLMAGMSAVIVLGMIEPEWAVRLAPLVMCVAGAATTLRFGWLDRRAARDG